MAEDSLFSLSVRGYGGTEPSTAAAASTTSRRGPARFHGAPRMSASWAIQTFATSWRPITLWAKTDRSVEIFGTDIGQSTVRGPLVAYSWSIRSRSTFVRGSRGSGWSISATSPHLQEANQYRGSLQELDLHHGEPGSGADAGSVEERLDVSSHRRSRRLAGAPDSHRVADL